MMSFYVSYPAALKEVVCLFSVNHLLVNKDYHLACTCYTCLSPSCSLFSLLKTESSHPRDQNGVSVRFTSSAGEILCEAASCHPLLSRYAFPAPPTIGALHEIMAIVELCDVPKKFRFDSILFDSNWHFHNIPVVNRVYAALL